MSDNSSLLLTGASGFIGRSVLRALAKGNAEQVVLLSSQRIEEWPVIDPRFSEACYGFDASDLAQRGTERFDTIVHLGAYTPKSPMQANDIDGAAVNIANTRHLLRTLPTPRRFVFASTLDVYGAARTPISESTPTSPLTLYAQSKLFCEMMLTAWAAQNGVELQILRIGHVYGPGEDAYRKLIPTVIRNLLAAEPPTIVSTGSELRAFLYVDDASRMILRAARRDVVEDPINVVSSQSSSVLSIVEKLCAIHKAETGQVIAPIIKGEPVPTIDLVFDATRLHAGLGQEATGLDEGLRSEYRYFRSLAA